MPSIDKSNPDFIYYRGAELPVEVYLSAAEATAVYGGTGTAGFYAFAVTEQSRIAHDVENDVVRNEAGEIVKVARTRDEALLSATLLQTDGATLDLCDHLSSGAHRYRIGAPVAEDKMLLFGIINGYLMAGFEMTLQEGERRTREIEVRGSRKDGAVALVFAEVDLSDQTSWPPELDPFKDAGGV